VSVIQPSKARLRYFEEPEFADRVTSAMLSALGVSELSEPQAGLSARLLLAGKPIEDMVAFSQVLVPPSTAVADRLADIDGLHEGVARVAESWMLAADVVTFCPMPLRGWQTLATDLLKQHKTAWIQTLDRLRQRSGDRILYHVPFLRSLVPEEGPEDWVTLERVTVDLTDIVIGGHTDPITITVLRRPFISWPVDPHAPGRHIATTLSSSWPSGLKGWAMSVLKPHWKHSSELVRPKLDCREFHRVIEPRQYRPASAEN
jgi:hypothetical protein